MALLDEKTIVGKGIVKEIEASAIQLVLQNLQQDQYQYPIKSFIREVASNCVDSIDEKNTAINILTGKDTIENNFSDLDSDLTRDSKFDESYYDLEWLNPEDKITITYISKQGPRDQIIVEDSGVGLGGSRLQGYFKPAYSSKRLNIKSLGKFGIGAKAGLSTGVESYQMISTYNGKRYSFDIYNDRYFSTTPKFNPQGFMNSSELWEVKVYSEDGSIKEEQYEVFFEDTTEKNSVKVLLDVKNPLTNRKKFLDAVHEQLTYFKNVRLFTASEDYDGDIVDVREQFFQTEVMYEDEFMVIPKDAYYTVPHMVINGVNYGRIDFSEMELDEKKGNIGIKVDPSKIDVNQSRESVRYSEKTREHIKECLENAIGVAQKAINEQLKETQTDFLVWLHACKEIKSKSSRDNSVFGRLSGLADLAKVKFTYKTEDSHIIYTDTNFNSIFNGFKISRTEVYKVNNVFKTTTKEVKSWEHFGATSLYRKDPTDTFSAIKMGYISELENYKTVYTITFEPWNPLDELTEKQVNLKKLVIEELKKSKYLKDYTNLEVPEEFLTLYKKEQEKEEWRVEQEKELASISEKELRKRGGKFLFHKFSYHSGRDWGNIKLRTSGLTKKKVEINIDDAPKYFSRDTTIYGTTEDLPMMYTLLTKGRLSPYNGGYDDWVGASGNLKFIVVAKDAVRYVNKYATHVKEALTKVEGTSIVLMRALKNWNTAKIFQKEIREKEYLWLYLMSEVDPDAYSAITKLHKFVLENGFDHTASSRIDGVEDMDKYLEKVAEFQLFCNLNTDKEAIANKAQEYFNSRVITNCDALNLEYLATWKALQDYSEELKPMLIPYSSLVSYSRYYNNNSYTTTDADSYKFDAEAVKEYIHLKQVPNFQAFLNARFTEFGVTLEVEEPQQVELVIE